jgi:hypothetical protein
MKKIAFGARPKPAPASSADAWVETRQGEGEPMKRLTLDVSLSLHKRIKSQCAQEGKKMADVIREFLETRFPAPPANRDSTS